MKFESKDFVIMAYVFMLTGNHISAILCLLALTISLCDDKKNPKCTLYKCELCGNSMPSKKFTRDGKSVCVYCIDIMEKQ